MRLLLIRHGQTPSNVAGELDTAFPGAGLTPLGQAQALALPTALSHEVIAGVYATPLLRTQLTAAPLARARGRDVHVQPGLEEIAAGALEMRNDKDSVQAYAACLAAWMHGDLDRAMPGGPNGHAFASRFDAAIATILDRHDHDDTVAVVGHGAAIRVYTAIRTGIDADAATKLQIMNTGMGVLAGHPDTGWDLVEWHDEPLGGVELADLQAHDVTGESTDEAIVEG